MYLTMILAVCIVLPIPVLMRRMAAGENPYMACLTGVMSSSIAILLLVMIAGFGGDSLETQLQAQLAPMISELAENAQLVNAMGLSDLTHSEKEKYLAFIYADAVDRIPAMMIMAAAVIAYIEYKVISSVLRKGGKEVCPLPAFADFSFPKGTMFGWIFIFAMTFLVEATGMLNENLLLRNMESLFTFVFVLQAIAVILFICRERHIPRAVGAFLAVLFLVTAIGQMLLIFLGLADLGFGLRYRILQNRHKREAGKK